MSRGQGADPTPRRATFRVIAVALPFGLLLAVEAVLQLFGFAPDPPRFVFQNDASERHPGMLRDHQGRFFELAPGYRHSPEHAGLYASASEGFRGRPATPAPEGLWRIALLGDSCAYGLDVPASDCLAGQLEVQLTARGLSPDQVEILNFGVPAYTTVQVRLLLREVLEKVRPDEVVFYLAGWNDAAPAVGMNDSQRLAASRSLFQRYFVRSALVSLLREALVSGSSGETVPGAAGSRVPAKTVGTELEAMLRLCRERGVHPVVVVPAHPTGLGVIPPRASRDADTVRRVSRNAGVECIDAGPLFREAEDLDSQFTDVVHPSPDGFRRLATSIAPLLVTDPLPLRPPGELAILSVSPDEVSTLGDEVVRVQLRGWQRGDELPVLVLGAARVLDVKAVGDHEIEGTVMANGPGMQGLLVQTDREAAWRPDAIRVARPRLALADDAPIRLVLRSRPGAQALLLASAHRRDHPEWDERGAQWLELTGETEGSALRRRLSLDTEGRAELVLPPLNILLGTNEVLWIQALVAPPGESPNSAVAQWTEPTALRREP